MQFADFYLQEQPSRHKGYTVPLIESPTNENVKTGIPLIPIIHDTLGTRGD